MFDKCLKIVVIFCTPRRYDATFFCAFAPLRTDLPPIASLHWRLFTFNPCRINVPALGVASRYVELTHRLPIDFITFI
jgi:hypothetical protein